MFAGPGFSMNFIPGMIICRRRARRRSTPVETKQQPLALAAAALEELRLAELARAADDSAALEREPRLEVGA